MADDPLRIAIAEQTAKVAAPHWPAAHAPPSAAASRAAIVKALNLVAEPVYFVGPDLRIVDANAAAERASGYPPSELAGTCFAHIIRAGKRLDAHCARLLDGTSDCETLRARHRSKDGTQSSVKLLMECIDQEDEPLIVAIVRRTAPRRAKRDAPAGPAEHDYLTHLPARAAFTERLRSAEQRARRRQVGFAVLFIDVDRFKHVNDSLGHRVGDLVLQTFGRRLRACVRPGDFVARYGGDEFVALVENVSLEAEVHGIAERIRRDLLAPIETSGGAIQVSVSVGVAIGHASASADDVVDQADRAMYEIKRRVR